MMIFGSILDNDRELAESQARGQAEALFTGLDSAWIRLERDGEGWAYEVHEGGSGVSLIARVLAALDEGPVVLRCSQRLIEVVRDRSGVIDTLILPEDDERDVTHLPAPERKQAKMRRLLPQGRGILIFGAVLAAAGIGAAGVAVSDNFLRPTVERVAVTATDPSQTPLAQQHILSPPDGQYIAAMRYRNGRWSIDTRPFAAPGVEQESGVDERE